jgi:hypothetical protein
VAHFAAPSTYTEMPRRFKSYPFYQDVNRLLKKNVLLGPEPHPPGGGSGPWLSGDTGFWQPQICLSWGWLQRTRRRADGLSPLTDIFIQKATPSTTNVSQIRKEEGQLAHSALPPEYERAELAPGNLLRSQLRSDGLRGMGDQCDTQSRSPMFNGDQTKPSAMSAGVDSGRGDGPQQIPRQRHLATIDSSGLNHLDTGLLGSAYLDGMTRPGCLV